MFIRLLALFTLIPLIELYVLIKVGSVIGALSTIALILLTGMAGASLARSQGFKVLYNIQEEMAAGHMPAAHLLDGAMILAGGMLLLTPGFCTDIGGLALLIPQSRQGIKKLLRRWLERQLESGRVTVIHRRF